MIFGVWKRILYNFSCLESCVKSLEGGEKTYEMKLHMQETTITGCLIDYH